ncbi:hypothetical protein J6590_015562 [Homalodisca vitripennis]|nr:hypothetical protein J6590_015562 [Homalodisca vitripennis]
MQVPPQSLGVTLHDNYHKPALNVPLFEQLSLPHAHTRTNMHTIKVMNVFTPFQSMKHADSRIGGRHLSYQCGTLTNDPSVGKNHKLSGFIISKALLGDYFAEHDDENTHASRTAL